MAMKKLPYRRVWQAKLLNRKLSKTAIPIDISQFRKIRGVIGLHGYRRVRYEDSPGIRAYRKDSYGMVFVYVNLNESLLEAKSESWGGLMGICSDFNLRTYRPV